MSILFFAPFRALSRAKFLMKQKLPREFYTRSNTLETAQDLLGKILVVPTAAGERVSGVIVETEAYLGAQDKAAHSYNNRRTKRTETMFAVGGTVYIFFIYGIYYQSNAVVGEKETPHAVLIRAVEPLENIEIMRQRRGPMKDTNLTSGPGKLCIALDIDRRFNGADLLGDEIWVEEGTEFPPENIVCGKRIGVDYAEEYAEKPWRFWVRDNLYISRR